MNLNLLWICSCMRRMSIYQKKKKKKLINWKIKIEGVSYWNTDDNNNRIKRER
jgi:hypothetical protein